MISPFRLAPWRFIEADESCILCIFSFLHDVQEFFALRAKVLCTWSRGWTVLAVARKRNNDGKDYVAARTNSREATAQANLLSSVPAVGRNAENRLRRFDWTMRFSQ